PRTRLPQAGERRDGGGAPGARHPSLSGGQPSDPRLAGQRHLPSPFARQPAVPPDQLDPRALHPRGLGPVAPVAGHVVALGEGRLHVQRAGDGLGRAGGPPGRRDDVTRADQGLGWHASPERALPADQPLLHDGHGQPAVRAPTGSVLPRWTGPDHDHVELVAHARSLSGTTWGWSHRPPQPLRGKADPLATRGPSLRSTDIVALWLRPTA